MGDTRLAQSFAPMSPAHTGSPSTQGGPTRHARCMILLLVLLVLVLVLLLLQVLVLVLVLLLYEPSHYSSTSPAPSHHKAG